ncbi:MAG: PcfB family protein [Clostridiales bacterium]|jgi:hypothetical protein|nr:PcfB family protein [Clostridiales bacterium]
MLQEQVNEKTVAFSIKTFKLTGRLLAKAMRAFLKNAREPTGKGGEKSLKSLSKEGATLADIEIPGEIGTFKRMARKYNVGFAVKRDDSVKPPNWVVFFKAKDSKALELAFNEYSKVILKRKEKPSMLKRLEHFKQVAKSLVPPSKNRDRGERELR